MSNKVVLKPRVYLISATLYDPNRATSFSITKSFSHETLESMTVAVLSRLFVEEIIPDCVKFVCNGRKHNVIRYGDDTETIVSLEDCNRELRTGKRSFRGEKKNPTIHCVSVSLPLDDMLTGAAGFLYPMDPILDYIPLARKSGNITPICIHSNGMRYEKAKKSKNLTVKVTAEENFASEDDLSDDQEFSLQKDLQKNVGKESVLITHTDDSSASVSQEDSDTCSQSSTIPATELKVRKPLTRSERIELASPSSMTLPIDDSRGALLPNIVQSPSSEQTLEKEPDAGSKCNILTPSPMKRRKRNKVNYKP